MTRCRIACIVFLVSLVTVVTVMATGRSHGTMTSALVMGHSVRATSNVRSSASRTRLARVAKHSRGTYFGKLITDRDSILERWPDRMQQPVRVWISTPDSLAEWKPEYVEPVKQAFEQWSATGIPVRFVMSGDSATAEVRVFWATRLDSRTAGMTFWQSDQRRWMRTARVTIALRASDGGRQNARGISSIALHEVGHLLGLSHSPHARDIMAPWVTARELSQGDQATVRLLYALPAGKI